METDEYLPDGLADVAAITPGDQLLIGGRWLDVIDRSYQPLDGALIVLVDDDDRPQGRRFLTAVGHLHRTRKLRPPAPSVST